MDCIIIDDDVMARLAIQELVKQTDFLKLKSAFGNPVEGLSYLNKEKTDLVFLDIEMPNMNGMEMLENLKHQPLVIFTTGNKEHAVSAFDFKTVAYLVKPVTYPKFIKAALKAKEIVDSSQQEERDFTFIKTDGIFHKVFYKDILFIEALGDYISIYTNEKKFTLYSTLKTFFEKLPPIFLRVHRSFIVNTTALHNVEDNTISLKGHLIPIGVSYKTEVYKRLNLI